MTRPFQVFIALLMVIAAIIWSACSSHAESPERDTRVPVRVESLNERLISIPVISSGRIAARVESRLSFKIGGIMSRIHVDEGARVSGGSLLASLDLAEFRARADQAASGYEKALRDLQRVERLHSDSVATLEQLQNARTGAEIARAENEVARFNLRHARIVAPADGRVLKRFGEVNELVSPGQPVFTFAPAGQQWVLRAGVSDRDVLRLTPGDSASIRLDAYPQTAFRGEVLEISAAADPRNGTFEVEFSIDAGGHRLISGFIGTVEVFPAQHERFVVVPVDALVEGNGLSGFVFAVHEGRSARKISVQIVHILDGGLALAPGSIGPREIITQGSAYLADGTAVKIVN